MCWVGVGSPPTEQGVRETFESKHTHTHAARKSRQRMHFTIFGGSQVGHQVEFSSDFGLDLCVILGPPQTVESESGVFL